MHNVKHEKISTKRLKDIIAQLADIIYLLCRAKEEDVDTVIKLFTNLTAEECEGLQILYTPNSDD